MLFSFFHKIIIASTALMAALMASLTVALSLTWASSAMAAGLVSYQAVYDIELEKTSTAADVKTITGQTHFIFEDVCDGWTSVEDYAISFGFGDEGVSNFISHYETWEAKDGSSFSFTALENSNIEGEMKYDGFANSSNGVAEAFHTTDGGTVTELPADTVFPIYHMQRLLEKAAKGEPLHQSKIFLGGDVDSSFYVVNAVLGKPKEEPAPRSLGAIGQTSYYPIRIAYFKPNSTNVEPEYEILFNLQPNGVIQSYVVDYGTFSMKATATTAQSITPAPC